MFTLGVISETRIPDKRAAVIKTGCAEMTSLTRTLAMLTSAISQEALSVFSEDPHFFRFAESCHTLLPKTVGNRSVSLLWYCTWYDSRAQKYQDNPESLKSRQAA